MAKTASEFKNRIDELTSQYDDISAQYSLAPFTVQVLLAPLFVPVLLLGECMLWLARRKHSRMTK